MKLYIHSSFGVLEGTPLTLQAIEDSIPEASIGADKDTEATENIAD